MSTLQGIPTQHGISILKSNLKQTAKKFQLIGALTHNAPTASLSVFHTDTIEASYYDDNGVLTFVFNLPIETHFNEYLYQIKIVDTSDQSIVDCQTPVIALAKGIGGMVTLKAAVSGQAGQVIFKHNQYVTETELLGLHFSKLKKELLALRVGETWESHDPNSVAGWIELNGGTLSRTVDDLLWKFAQRTGLVIGQTLKNANPQKYAMYFGDGDGAKTFTLPNHHLGHFVRGAPSGVNHGDTQGDAIRNITGSSRVVVDSDSFAPSGAIKYEGKVSDTGVVGHTDHIVNFGLDASLVVPTSDENRPYTANLSIKIHRGWM